MNGRHAVEGTRAATEEGASPSTGRPTIGGGSTRRYAREAAAPAGQTAADLNFDMLAPFGQTRDVSLTGAERTTLWPLVQQNARRIRVRGSRDVVCLAQEQEPRRTAGKGIIGACSNPELAEVRGH